MGGYSGKLFVDRAELNDILDWIRANPGQEPILSLVAPPGTGKTWLMQAAVDNLDGEERIVLSLNLPDYLTNGNLGTAIIKEWLKDIAYKTVRKSFPVPRFNSLAHITQSIGVLVDTVHQAGLKMLVLVDGYDEVSVEVRQDVDAWIFLPFIRRKCIKILTGYRTGCRLEDGRLRQNERRLPLAPLEKCKFGVLQFQRIFEDKTGTHPGQAWVDLCGDWIAKLEIYQWDHPFINSFLFERAWNGATSLRDPTKKDLRDCIDEVIVRPGRKYPHAPLTPGEYQKLYEIAHQLESEWLMSDYEREFKVVNGHEQVDPLLNKGVVEYVRGTQRYRVAPGLYELLLEL